MVASRYGKPISYLLIIIKKEWWCSFIRAKDLMLRNTSAEVICYLYKVMSASNLHSFAVIRAKEHYDFDLMCLHIKRELYASRRVNGDTKIIVC